MGVLTPSATMERRPSMDPSSWAEAAGALEQDAQREQVAPDATAPAAMNAESLMQALVALADAENSSTKARQGSLILSDAATEGGSITEELVEQVPRRTLRLASPWCAMAYVVLPSLPEAAQMSLSQSASVKRRLRNKKVVAAATSTAVVAASHIRSPVQRAFSCSRCACIVDWSHSGGIGAGAGARAENSI